MKRLIYIIFILSLGFFSACEDDNSQPLEALFKVDKETIAVNDKIMFMDQSLGNPVRWNWYFEGGDPATSQLFSPEIVYKTPGTYSVKLVVGRGSDSTYIEKSSFITVEYPSEINVSFTADKRLGTDDDVISFTDQTTGYPTTWEWEFIPTVGSKITSAEQNPSLKFPPGVYTVKLTATNPKSSSSFTETDYLTIIDKNSVAADFAAVRRTTYGGGKIQFEDKTSGNVKNWSWTFEGGTPSTSNEQNPIVTYNAPGKYKVKLVSSNDVNSSTMEKESYAVVIPGEDLIMFMPFDGDANDIGPNAMKPEIISKGDVTIAFDKPSRRQGTDAEDMFAAEFTSQNVNNMAILSLPDHDALDLQSSNFTVAFWVRVSDNSGNRAVYHHGSGPNARPDNQNRQSWFRFQPSNQFIRFVIEYTGFAGNWADYTAKSMFDDQWHHYVCVHDAGSTYLYIDGVQSATSLNKPLKEIDRSPYFIGCNYRYTAGNIQYENFLRGFLDDYVLYKRALTAAEAQALYNY